MAANREIEKLERRWNENRQGTSFAPYAEALRKVGELERAQEVLQQGLANHPDHIPGNIVLGRCCLDMGADGEAEAAFNRVLGLDAENVIALKALADITERHGRFAETDQWLRQLISFDPSNDEAKEQMARVEAARELAAAQLSPPPVASPTPQPQVLSDASPETATATPDEEDTVVVSAVRRAAPAEPMPTDGRVFDPTEIATVAMMPAMTPVKAPPVPPAEPDVALEAPLLGAKDLEVLELPPEEPIPVGREPQGIESGVIHEELPETMPDEAGLEESRPVVPARALDIGVEVPEEIVLRPSGSASEFQTPSDADDLIEPATTAHSEFQTPDASDDLLRTSGSTVAHEEYQPPPDVLVSHHEGGRHATPAAGLPLIFPSGEEGAAYEQQIEPVEAELPEPALAEMPDSTEVAFPEPALADATYAEEAQLPEPALAEVLRPVDALPPEPAVGEPDMVVTETMAEVYVRQGHRAEAVRVYRQLLERTPHDERLQSRLRELEEETTEPGVPTAQWPSYSVLVTGGESVEAFFRSLIANRPPAPTGDGLGAAEPSAAPTEGDGDSASAGAPTRPAQDALSLSAIFGEENSPVPPVVPATRPSSASGGGPPAPGAPGYSFDQFFGGNPEQSAVPRSSGGETRQSRPAGIEEDLDQFQNWLKSLKR